MDATPLALLLALPAGLLLVGAATRLAPALGLVDVPGARSVHVRPVPRAGGVGWVLATLAVGGPFALAGSGAAALPWLAGLVLFAGIGLWDDRARLGPRTKLLLQAGAAALVVALGPRWEGRGIGAFGPLGFGAATPVMTWLWIVAVVTLVNLYDGIDLITCATWAPVLALAAGGGAGPGQGALLAAGVGALLALAAWNATPARTFTGDAGTHAIGFLVATAALHLPAGDAVGGLPWPLASAPLLPAVLDVAWGLATKRRLGLRWSAAHREHLHQRLVRLGWPHPAVALRYGLLAVLAAVLVGVVLPRHGLGACLAASAVVLAGHLLSGARSVRRLERAAAAPPLRR